MSGPRHLLILRALGLGDFLTGVPAYRALRRAYPDHEVVLAAPPELAGLAALTGAIDRVLPARGLHRIGWQGPPPEVAVNLHGRGPQSHRYLMQVRPDRLIAFASPAAMCLDGPPWRADEHEVRRWCGLLTAAGIPADPAALALSRPQVRTRIPFAFVVHPGAAVESKRWPPERFAAVAGELRRAGHRVVITGSPAERTLALRVAGAAEVPERDVLAGATSLPELAALVADAAVVISGDTGIAHLATAYGTPSVVLFGPDASPREWGPPPGRPQHVVLRRAQLRAISPLQVLTAVRQAMSAIPIPR